MKRFTLTPFILVAALSPAVSASCPDFLNHSMRQLASTETIQFCEAYEGKALLIVNTASYCGYTSQFEGLEQIHQAYEDDGLVVLGFSSDDFFQEDNDDKDILQEDNDKDIFQEDTDKDIFQEDNDDKDICRCGFCRRFEADLSVVKLVSNNSMAFWVEACTLHTCTK